MTQLSRMFNASSASSPAIRRVAGLVLGFVLISGAAFRLAEYVNNRSLWLDEAALAQNILHLPAGDLALGRLTDDQVAPPGFLLTVKGLTLAAGASEQILRLLPLLAGLGALGLFGWLAWRRLDPVGAVAATVLMAWSWPLIYYSNELKQYSTDAFVALVFFTLAEKMDGTALTRARAWRMGGVGAGALLFSHPAVFLLGAWGGQKIYQAQKSRQREEMRRLIIMGAVWLLLLAAVVGVNIGTTLGNARLVTYHAENYLRLWPPGEAAAAWREGLLGTWMLATAESTSPLWLILLLVGFGMGWQKHRRETVFIGLVVLFTLLASVVHVYPWTPRLLLFLLPLLFWFVGRGADGLTGLAQGKAWPAVVAAVFIGAWPLGREAVDEAWAPIAREHLRPVVAQLAEQARPGDVVLVFDYTRYAFDYYWLRVPHAEVPVRNIIFAQDEAQAPAQLAAQVAPFLAGDPPRVWLVATHYEIGAGQDNLRGLVAALRQRFPNAADFVPPGGTAQGVVFFQPGKAPPAPVSKHP